MEHFRRSNLKNSSQVTFLKVSAVDFWVIVLSAGLLAALSIAAALLWVGINAILHGRGLTREAAITVTNLSRALRSIYNDTLGEALPDDWRDLLRKLARPGRREAKRGIADGIVAN